MRSERAEKPAASARTVTIPRAAIDLLEDPHVLRVYLYVSSVCSRPEGYFCEDRRTTAKTLRMGRKKLGEAIEFLGNEGWLVIPEKPRGKHTKKITLPPRPPHQELPWKLEQRIAALEEYRRACGLRQSPPVDSAGPSCGLRRALPVDSGAPTMNVRTKERSTKEKARARASSGSPLAARAPSPPEDKRGRLVILREIKGLYGLDPAREAELATLEASHQADRERAPGRRDRA